MLAFHTHSSSNLSAISRKAFLLFFISLLASAAEVAEIQIFSPCSDSEIWRFSKRLEKLLPEEFRQLPSTLSDKTQLEIRSFSEALPFTGKKSEDTVRAMAEYGIARTLFHAAVFGLAAEKFDKLVAQPTTTAKLPIQLAALSCLESIHRKYAVFSLSPEAFQRLGEYLKEEYSKSGILTPRDKNTLADALLQKLFSVSKNENPGKLAKEILSQLKGMGAYEDLANGFWDVKSRRASGAVAPLLRFVSTESLPSSLEAKRDSARLLLARAYYGLEDHKNAIKQLELIDKRSNELVHSLIQLALAQLMAGDYPKAVGASLGLQSGGLKQTFSPESLMVATIALNELCQFPESLQMVKTFKNNYQGVFFWLKEHLPKGVKAKDPLYPIALSYLTAFAAESSAKNIVSTKVPNRVASEWIRSPLFISKQESINHLFRTLRKIPKITKLAQANERVQGREILTKKRALVARYQKAKAENTAKAAPKELLTEISAFRFEEAKQARLTAAVPQWTSLLEHYQRRAEDRRNQLTREIEAELGQLNQRMFNEITAVMENNELIEAEIWNGASQDMVWQNAHPEFQKMVDQGKISSEQRAGKTAGEVYNWGSSGRGLSGTEEVWEDELGGIQANLQNNCTNKERYMKLQERPQ